MDLLAVQGTLKGLLQHHRSKASILRRSVFFIVQLSHPYMTTGKILFVAMVNGIVSLTSLSDLLLSVQPISFYFYSHICHCVETSK